MATRIPFLGRFTATSGLVALLLAVSGCGQTTSTTPDDATADSTADTSTSDTSTSDAGDTQTADPHTLTVMTYNVMCPFCMNSDHPDWPQDWTTRLPMIQDTIARFDPDLVGVQETFTPDPSVDIVADITATGGVYESVFYIKKPTDPATALGDSFVTYSDAAILYRKTRFDLKEQGVIWLSPTPDIAFSNGFAKGGQFPRLIIWARLHDKLLDRTFIAASTHFDNNTPSQKLSAPLALERFAALAAKEPVIFVGDFNSTPDTEAYAILAKGVDGKGFHFDNAFDLAAHWQADSNRVPEPTYDLTQRIDHFWLAGAAFTVPEWHVDLHAYGDLKMWPSDHDPMVAKIRW